MICKDVTRENEYRRNLQSLNEALALEVEMRKRAQAQLAEQRDRIGVALAESQGQLAQQVHDWQQLHGMAFNVLKAGSLQEQFQVVLETVCRFHGCLKGVVSLYDVDKAGLVVQAAYGVGPEGLVALECVPAGAGACGTAFQDRHRVIVEDTESDPLYENYRGFAHSEEIRALYSTPFFTHKGDPLGVLSVYFPTKRTPTDRELQLTDICVGQISSFVERARAEEELQRVLERSHRILETMSDGFLLMDREFRVLQINAEALRIDGRTAEQILGRSHWELWPGSEDLPVGRAYKEAMASRVPVALEQHYVHEGKGLWLDIRVDPQPEGLVLLYRDITVQKQAQEALRLLTKESEKWRRLYETILSSTPDLVYVFSLDHRFTYANDVLLQMWDKTWDEAIGKTCLELGYEPWHAEMHSQEIEHVKATKRPIRGEVPFSGAFGRRIYDYIFVPVIGPDGEVEAVAGTTRDVTDRKKIEDALRDANKRKDEFLAMLAHELRNPLAPIAAAAEILQIDQSNTQRVKQAAQVVKRQARHLSGLIDDLLDVSRVSRGLVTLEKAPQLFKEVIQLAIEQVRPIIEVKRHELVTILPTQDAEILGDQKRLVQIVANVLNNAAKYTPEGGMIRLTFEVKDELLVLNVEDNGIGIDPALQPRVFDMFTQAERAKDRSQGGLGIGLALVKSLAELHGGTVRCTSEGAGKGSQFTIQLPRLLREVSTAVDRRGTTPSGVANGTLRVMVVDDNQDAADTLGEYFRCLGHNVTIEYSAQAAIRTASAQLPDVCFLDIGLPDMDGNALARQLRNNPGLKETVLIAVTGYGQNDDRVQAMASGFDHHLIKPVNLEDLKQLTNRLARA